VTLKGIVNSEGDKNLATIEANTLPGVFQVTNELRVVK
jgi:osmotically-inducible protein OsmY